MHGQRRLPLIPPRRDQERLGNALTNKTIPLYRLRRTARRRHATGVIARPSERDAVSFSKSRDEPKFIWALNLLKNYYSIISVPFGTENRNSSSCSFTPS